jgi:hypothetical protein
MTHIAITNSEAPTRLDGSVHEITGVSGGETQWPLSNSFHGDPGRHVLFQENWRGFNTWNSWQISFNPPIRRQVEYDNPGTMQNVLAARTPPQPPPPQPIPIGSYALNTGQINVGYAGGKDWRDGIRRR